mgnify:CR=1 FL=1
MKSRIIFFDNSYESANGTFRGLIGFFSILILYSLLHYSNTTLFKNDYKIVITALLLCSCLGVIQFENSRAAAVLGALVSFVIFSLIFVYSDIHKTIQNGLQFILAGILIGIITNLMIWKVYWETGIRIKGNNQTYLYWQILNCIIFITVFFIYK